MYKIIIGMKLYQRLSYMQGSVVASSAVHGRLFHRDRLNSNHHTSIQSIQHGLSCFSDFL